MRRVTVVSPLRDSGLMLRGFIRHFIQMAEYDPEVEVRLIAVEGDSVDDTLETLRLWVAQDERVTVVRCETGAPKFPSVVNPERFKNLARIFNTGLDAVDLDWSDYVMFIPSDVEYEPDLLTRLLARDKDMIAPMFWRWGIFYDIWGFIRDGQPFTSQRREWYTIELGDEPVQMDTVGGCILMRAEIVTAGCRYTPDEVDRGLCKAARALGYTIWCDPVAEILHIN